MTKFAFALIALAAAMLAGWQLATIFPPDAFKYQVAGWVLFISVSLGALGVATR